jgi:hypothetical protein
MASLQIMRHKILTFIILLSFFGTFAYTQPVLDGVWEGEITMESNGKTVQTFKLIVHLTQDSLGKLSGRSWIWYKALRANFDLKVEQQKELITVRDAFLIDADNLPSGEWCEKVMELTLVQHKKKTTLEGKWRGKTSFSQCTPGKVFLKKNVDRV